MTQPPVNVSISRLLVAPAELPGSAVFWAVYERLDSGAVVHARFVGLRLRREGETAEDALERLTRELGE